MNGYSVLADLHGRARETDDKFVSTAVHFSYCAMGDVDFYYEPGLENSERLYQALLKFWDGNIPGTNSPPALAVPGLVLQFGRPPNRVDLLSRVSGIEFESAWQRRVVTVMGEVELPYLGLEDLVEAKRAAGRPKDLQDLIYLEKLFE